MLFQKWAFFRLISKNKIAFLNLSILVLIFCAVLARFNNENEIGDSIETYLPINNVETNKSVYAITIDLSGEEKTQNVKLLSQVMKGLKVKGTFFVSADWIKKNQILFNKIKEDGHFFGLKISNNSTNMTRSEAMYYLAAENDDFYRQSEIYPSVVRIEQDKSGKIPELINAFGQTYVSYSVILEDTSVQIDSGDIVFVEKINENTPYIVAEIIGKCSSNNLVSVSLNDLLNLKSETAVKTESE